MCGKQGVHDCSYIAGCYTPADCSQGGKARGGAALHTSSFVGIGHTDQGLMQDQVYCVLQRRRHRECKVWHAC